jgi:ArsR family transcriptional regulator, lead/cadmium/zinc/bismuth-responsive transcriptional repressor
MANPLRPLRISLAGWVAELLAVFGDPNRVRLLWLLTHRELNVGALAAAVAMSESAVSHHLRRLRQLRLVRVRKDGREVLYRVDDGHIIALLEQKVDHVQHA